jgi:ribose transport system substrate-binding protein
LGRRFILKKHILAISLMIIAFVLCGCAGQVIKLVPQDISGEDEIGLMPLIGLSVKGEGGFENEFADIAVKIAKDQGYELMVKDAGMKADTQISDIETLITEGAQAIIINPVDVDRLEHAAAECDAAGISVINALDQINGKVDCLICPDYAEIGKKGARLLKEAAKDNHEDKADVFLLEGEVDSFIMQLIHDGYTEEAKTIENMTVLGSYRGDPMKKDYLSGLDLANLEGATSVFAQDETIANGIAGLGQKKLHIVCVGASKDTVSKIKSKDFYAAVFYGPESLANLCVAEAVKCAGNEGYVPPLYIEVPVAVVSESSVDQYVSQAKHYAEPIA